MIPELKSGYPLIDDLIEETEIDDALNIVVIGGSFVWGAYSTNRNELFWLILENNLRSEGVRANVYGVAATGANAYEEFSWLADSSLVQDLDPDIVIFGYVYNDADDSVVINASEIDWNEGFPLLSKLGRLFPNLYSRLINKIPAETMYSDKYSNSDYVDMDGAPSVLKGRFYEKYKTDFVEKLDAYTATADFPVAVMTLPTLPKNAMLEALYQPLEGLYSSCENIRFYDCLGDFNRFASLKHSDNYSVNIADFHPESALGVIGGYQSLYTDGILCALFTAIAVSGVILIVLGGVLPFVLEKPVKLMKKAFEFIGKYILRILLIPVYIIMTVINLFIRKRYSKKFRFLKWDENDTVTSEFAEYESIIHPGHKYVTFGILSDVFSFFANKQMYVIIPVIAVLLVIGLILFFASSNAVFSFIYTLF